jgi:hypothetical protein
MKEKNVRTNFISFSLKSSSTSLLSLLLILFLICGTEATGRAFTFFLLLGGMTRFFCFGEKIKELVKIINITPKTRLGRTVLAVKKSNQH